MTVDARHLRVFLAIAQEGSITAAAEALGVSQPAASRTLRQLESHLRVTLVDRSTHHLRLTTQGAAYRHRAAAAIGALDDALDSWHSLHRPLLLGHAWAAFGRITTRVTSAWEELYPDDPLELHRIDHRYAGLETGEVDAAIVRDFDPDAPMSRKWIGAEPRMAALPAGHRLSQFQALRLDQLAEETVVVNRTSGTTTAQLWQMRAPARWIEVHTTDDWLLAIAAGRGIGITSDATVATLSNPEVIYRPLRDAPPVTVELAWSAPARHPLLPDLAELCASIALGR